MKKSVIGTIAVSGLCIIGALFSVYVVEGSDRDYTFLFIAIPVLVLDIGYLIYLQTKGKRKK